MIHHQDSSWGLTMSVHRGGGGRHGGQALAGHMDMIPRTSATLSRGRKGKLG